MGLFVAPYHSVLIIYLQKADWPTAAAAIIQIIVGNENSKVEILPTGLIGPISVICVQLFLKRMKQKCIIISANTVKTVTFTAACSSADHFRPNS